jgi:hypothetical protein
MIRGGIAAALMLLSAAASAQQLYRCSGVEGKRLTKDRHDIRVGETCTEVSQAERARMKAIASAPPNEADKRGMTARAEKLDFWALCTELGRVLRRPDETPKGAYWKGVVVSKAQVPAIDHGGILDRRLRIGMDECSVVAILGKPNDLNRTNTAGGRRDQLVYRAKRLYVYTVNGIVQAWQE